MGISVAPYVYEFKANTKERWIGRALVDVLSEEFRRRTRLYFEKAVTSGAVKINGHKTTAEYVLRSGDLITHLTHRHEPPIPEQEIEEVYEDEEIIVVDKPSGIPCHPNSSYNRNTLTEIVKEKKGLAFISAANRLDKQTSGVVLLAKTPQAAVKYHKTIAEGGARKFYLARVSGRFPAEKVDVSLPLCVSRSTCTSNICQSAGESEGKESRTEFRLVCTNGKESVVLCQPVTGRTHQIRVHLQAIGHPISNDMVYRKGYIEPEEIGVFREGGKIVITPERYFKIFDDQKRVLDQRYAASLIDTEDARTDAYRDVEEVIERARTEDPELFIFDTCMHCRNSEDLEKLPVFTSLYLHALEYSINGLVFRTKAPRWIKEVADVSRHIDIANLESFTITH